MYVWVIPLHKATNITRTGKDPEISYRPWLWHQLIQEGVNVDMVGYCKTYFGGSNAKFPANTGEMFDNESEAYYGINSNGWLNGDNSSGWTGSALPKFSDRINDKDKGYTPDFALIHIGTNDDNKDNPIPLATTVSNIKETIKILRAKNPNVVVLLSKLITTWSKINPAIEGICSSMTTAQSPVILVDCSTGFINNTELPGTMTYDWVHPNKAGQIFMKDKFYAAIMANLNDKVKPSLAGNLTVNGITSTSAVLNWNLGTDNYGVKSYEVYINDKLVSTTKNDVKTYNANNLLSGTDYNFKVVAKDFGGNASNAILASAKTTGITGTVSEQLSKIFLTNDESNIGINNAQGCKVQVINMYGQVVAEKNITSDNEQIFSSPNYSGSMIVKITSADGNSLNRRVVIAK